jgi:hypothetical protein
MTGRQHPMHQENTTAVPTPQRTGPLRDGNQQGNPNLTPRCGAKARTMGGNPCRAPAMKNGRCRMHGGKATGPTTADGLARLALARTKHGRYNAANRAAQRRASALKAETRAQRQLQRAAAVIARSQALLVLHRAGAHPLETIAPHRLRQAPTAAPPEHQPRSIANTPHTVKKHFP